MEVKISKKNPTIVLIAPSEVPIISQILVVSKEFDCSIHKVSTNIVSGESGHIEVTFQAVFSNGGEERVMEYISELEKATKALNIHLLSHV